MEYLQKCPVCHSMQEPVFFLRCRDYLTGSGWYHLVRCPDCGGVFTNPRPKEENMARFYKSEAYISHYDQKETVFKKIYFWARAYMLKRKARLIKKLNLTQGRLLDVGCGTGAFASYMQKTGFIVMGVEPDQKAREIALSKGVNAVEAMLGPGNNSGQGFDLITMWHVLEHHANPLAGLKRYYEQLVEGGYLIVAVPQFESFDALFYKSFWAAYDLPRHLVHFNKGSLILAAESQGFIYIAESGLPFDAFYVSILSEKNQRKTLGFIRAFGVAIYSNLLGLLKIRPWSSQVFVFQKPLRDLR